MNVDRARGALLGLAVGDALGTTLEFSTPRAGGFPSLLEGPHRDIVGGGPFGVAPGQVTDDTHMACCLAASLRERGRFDPIDVARRYVEWRRHTFDIGTTTATAVGLLGQGVIDAGRRVWEASGRRGAANGSLMRTAPIGVYFWADARRRRDAALADSALTHFDPRCRLACAALDAVIAEAIADRQIGLTQAVDEVETAAGELAQKHPELDVAGAAGELREDLRLAAQDDPGLDGLIHSAQGFVRVAFRLAFWELAHAPSFEGGLIDVVNRGGDTDTNGAIAGALLGARHGAGAIPAAWTRRVLAALQDGPAGPLRDAYHPKVLLEMLAATRG